MRAKLELGRHEDSEATRGVARGATVLAVGVIALGMAGTAYAEQPDRSEWNDRPDTRSGNNDTDRSQDAAQEGSPDSTLQESSTDNLVEQPAESPSQESDDSYDELLSIANQVVTSGNATSMTSVREPEDNERSNPTVQLEETNNQTAEEDNSQPEEARASESEHEEQPQDEPEVAKTSDIAETESPSDNQTEESSEEKAIINSDAAPNRNSDREEKDHTQDSRRGDSSKDNKNERDDSSKSSSSNENSAEEQSEPTDVEAKNSTPAPVKDNEREQDVKPVEEPKEEVTKEESKPEAESEPEVKKSTTREHEEKAEKSKAFKSDLAGMADQSIVTVAGSSEEQPWGDHSANDTKAEPEEAAPVEQPKEEDQAEPSTEARSKSESEVDDPISELAKIAGQVIVSGSTNSIAAASSQESEDTAESSSESQDSNEQADVPSADEKVEESPAEESTVNSGEDEEKESSFDDIAGMADESIIVEGTPSSESDDNESKDESNEEEAEQDPNDIRSWADQSIESGSGDEGDPSDDGDKTESEGEIEESSEEKTPEPKEEPADEPAEEKAPEPSAKPEEAPKKSVSEIADEVLEDKWGVDEDRERRLAEAGYDYDEVQAEVNKKIKERDTKKIEEAGGNPLDLPISTGSAPSYSNMDRPIQSNLKSKYGNVSGKLNSGELATVHAPWRDNGMNEWKLQPDAARAFEAMNAEFKARTGESLCVAQTYRSYQGQLDAKARHGRGAATPGNSNHGWGLAIDFCNPKSPNGQVTRDNEFYKVLEEIGPRYGWVNPHRYDPRFQEFHNTSKKIDEPWHFEYVEKVYPDYYTR